MEANTPAPKALNALFPPDFLRHLERLHLLARQISRGRTRAERRSVKRGVGLEFADYRPFAPGDDIRSVDWNAYARTRHLLLKLFEEEEDLHVHLLLDQSASMAWGKPPKFDQARRLVAGLAYLAISNLDRAAIHPIGGDPGAPTWGPSRGRAKFLRLLRHLENSHTAGGGTPLADSMRQWLATKPRRGLVIWVTDCWGTSIDDFFQALDRLRHNRHDTGVIQVRHADEAEPGELGEWELEEVETGLTRPVIIDRAMAKAYRERVAEYETRLAEYCRRHGIPHFRMDAAETAIGALERLLHTGGFVR